MISIRDVSTPGTVELVLYRDGWFVCLVVTPIRSSVLEAKGECMRHLVDRARKDRRIRALLRRALLRDLTALRGVN